MILKPRGNFFCRGHGVNGDPEFPGRSEVRWLGGCNNETNGSRYRSDHERRIWNILNVEVFVGGFWHPTLS